VKIGLDTSVLLRLLIGEPKPQAERAWQALVEVRAAKNEVVVSDLVVSETYFALQFHYGVPKSAALEQLRALLESKQVTPTGGAGEVLAKPGLAKAKPGFVDRMIHAAYFREGGEMLTFEKAAAKLSHTRVLSG
jgi:predicted nucleic acid-binding protein